MGLNMLIYHPLYDSYHSVFRMLQLLETTPQKEYDILRLRIMDFYLVFPSLIKQMSFPRDDVKLKKFFKNLEAYEEVKNPQVLFLRAEPYQMLACKYLEAMGLVDVEKMKDRVVLRTANALPEELANAVVKRTENMPEEIISFLTTVVADLNMSGSKGLKTRTGLLEYRYDT